MLSENFHIVPVGSDLDLNSAATVDCDSINMENVHKVTFIVGLQTLGGANPDFAPYGGASNGTCTAVVPFKYAYGSAAQAAANCDVLADWTDASALVAIDHSAKDNFMLIIEVDAKAMAKAGYSWITLRFADTLTGATGNVQVHAVCQMRYAKNQQATVLA